MLTLFGCQVPAWLLWSDEVLMIKHLQTSYQNMNFHTGIRELTDRRWPRPLTRPRPLLQQQQLGSPAELEHTATVRLSPLKTCWTGSLFGPSARFFLFYLIVLYFIWDLRLHWHRKIGGIRETKWRRGPRRLSPIRSPKLSASERPKVRSLFARFIFIPSLVSFALSFSWNLPLRLTE